jgi:hypothetical protein
MRIGIITSVQKAHGQGAFLWPCLLRVMPVELETTPLCGLQNILTKA